MDAYVVTGSPGVGKHTAAPALAAAMGLGLLDLNRVAEDAGLRRGGEVDAGELAGALSRRLAGGALVVGHMAPYALDGRRVRRAVVLRRSPYALEAAYRARGYSATKAADNAGAEILGVIAHDAARAFGAHKVDQIDVTGAGAAGVASRARRLLRGGGGGDEVDWLGTVARRGDLGRFFPAPPGGSRADPGPRRERGGAPGSIR